MPPIEKAEHVSTRMGKPPFLSIPPVSSPHFLPSSSSPPALDPNTPSPTSDVAPDGLIWDSGYATLLFRDDAKHEAITFSVAAKYIRLPADYPDEAERGKLAFQELFHDMKNVGKKIEEIRLAGQGSEVEA